MRKVTIFSLLFVIGFLANAQDHDFKVLASQGTNKVKKSGAWENLYTGDELEAGQKIKLTSGSYVGLVHKKGQTIELKKEGRYSVKKLSQKVAGKQSDFTEKYASFVADKMTKDEEDDANLEVTGSVERATDDSAIQVYSPKKGSVLPETVMLGWSSVKGVKTYQIMVANMYEDPILSKKTDTNNLEIDLSEIKDAVTETEKEIALVSVEAADDPSVKSRQYALQFVSDEKAEDIRDEFQKVKSGLGEKQSALDQMVMGAFYESNGLLLNAMTSYQRALKMAPDVQDYQKAYARFMKRHNF